MTTRITLFGDSYIEHLDSHIDQFNTNTLTVSDIGYLLIKYKFILVYFYFNCSHGNLFDNFSEINDRPRREKISSGVCEQQRLRPACAFTQSDQPLCYSFIGKCPV